MRLARGREREDGERRVPDDPAAIAGGVPGIAQIDQRGRDSFETLQQRVNLSNPKEVDRASRQAPVAFVAFDILFYDGDDTTAFPLEERRLLLEHAVEENDRIRLNPYIDGQGVAFTTQAESLGLEGVMAKRLGSRYRPGRRSDDWRKIKLRSTQDCVILGWTPGQGGRSGTVGALLVGAFDPNDGELRWVGQVGSGLTDRMLSDLLALLDAIDSPLVGWHFDIGNVGRYGSAEDWITVLGKRILKLHIKEFNTKDLPPGNLGKGFGVRLLEGTNNWPAIMKALDDTGYDGWGISEQPGNQSKDAAALKDLSERMDKIFAI